MEGCGNRKGRKERKGAVEIGFVRRKEPETGFFWQQRQGRTRGIGFVWQNGQGCGESGVDVGFVRQEMVVGERGIGLGRNGGGEGGSGQHCSS